MKEESNNKQDFRYKYQKNHYVFPVILLILILLSLGFEHKTFEWIRQPESFQKEKINTIAVRKNDGDFYIGTTAGLFRLNPQTKKRSLVLQVNGHNRDINHVGFSPDGSKIYAAADSGLYVTDRNAQQWQKIFHANQQDERRCLFFYDAGKRFYLATGRGLYIREENGQGWKKKEGVFQREPVFRITGDARFVYFSSADKVFRIDQSQQIVKQVFRVFSSEAEAVETSQERLVRDLFILPQTDLLFIATTKGIFKTNNAGDSWQRVSANTVLLKQVNRLVVKSHDDLWIATDEGVFRYSENHWRPVYQGMASGCVQDMILIPHGRLAAATENEIYLLEDQGAPKARPTIHYAEVKKEFSLEPTIGQIHTMAIEYAEVNPSKIKRWREAARKKAWLPKLSVGVDGDKNRTINDSVWGSYTSGGQLFLGPDDKTFYDNFGWSASFSWDLGDLIWSSDQTSIDSRSKMMVELREDILDQVTRLYFERRRLQVELLNGRPRDQLAHLEKQMRIEELTALIDAMTGGGFSRAIKKGRNEQ